MREKLHVRVKPKPDLSKPVHIGEKDVENWLQRLNKGAVAETSLLAQATSRTSPHTANPCR